jgi:hypothetical protein
LNQLSLLAHAVQATEASRSQSKISSIGVLLAFKALTAHLQHKPSERGSRFVTSDLCADAALRQIGHVHGAVPLETIQTLLMVGYYRWAINRSDCGVGIIKRAIEHALASSYQHNQNETIDHGNNQDKSPYNLTTSEVWNRTFWSCYILDAYICWIEHRPQSLSLHDLRLQLPRTESSFLCGEEVQTRLLEEDEKTYEKRIENTREKDFEVEEGDVSRFVRLVRLYGKIYNLSAIQELRYL